MTILDVNDILGSAGDSIVSSYSASPQTTLRDQVKLSGMGLHSGCVTSVVIHPAPEDTGIVFYDGDCKIKALALNVIDTSRGTTIGLDGSQIRTIEHLMASLRGKGIDNAIVEVVGNETPALDGSALPYVEAIDAVGLTKLDAFRKVIELKEPVCVRYKDTFILAVPAHSLRLTYVMNYNHPMIGSQSVTYLLDDADFGEEIAPARTFGLYEEVAELLGNDLALGGTLDNAIVIWQDRMSSDLRFPDELVRHKVMDLVGDLALVGGLLHAEVLAVKSGHALNVEFVKAVNAMQTQEANGSSYLQFSSS